MVQARYTTFDTDLGTCGVAWTSRGLTDVLLPEARDSELYAKLRVHGEPTDADSAPAWVRRAIARIRRHLAGKTQDLSRIPVVLDGAAPFTRRVYELLRTTPAGQTLSYGQLARQAGSPGAARAVGQAMANNPLPLVVPCHRVLGAGGSLGGFSAHGGTKTKARLLRLEGVAVGEGLFAGGDTLPFDAARARRVLARADPTLGKLMKRVGPLRLRLKPPRTTFAALAEAIVYQQLTTRAGAAIHGRLCAQLSPRRALGPNAVFAASDDELRGAGLSRSKAAALRDLADQSKRGRVPSLSRLARMSDEAIVESLTVIRGIGPWTVQMLLIFQLGRPDVMPALDYGLRKGFVVAFYRDELPPPRELEEYAERWRPYRTVASWYLWRALELPD
jgi:O-6-methylguanine DNA methyltransferase